MHIILEGIFPLEFSLCISSHIAAKYYNADDLIEFLDTFPYHMMDKRDKPNTCLLGLANANSQFSQTSGQTLVIMRHLPFFMENRIPNDDPQWKALRLLLRLCQLVFSAHYASLHTIHQMSILICDHNAAFRQLYPDNYMQARYPRIITEFH